MSAGIGALLSALWLVAIIASGKSSFRHGNMATGNASLDGKTSRQLLIRPFYLMLERIGFWDRLQPFMAGLHGKLATLGGSGWNVESTRVFAAHAVGTGYAALVGGVWLAAASGEPALLALGALIGAVLPAAKWKDVSAKVERRKQDMLLVLPEVLSKLMLLLGAGETMQRALQRCALVQSGRQPGALIEELRRANEAIRNGESFAAAMEAFSKRCAVQEVSLFTTTLLLNYRRGGDRLALSLKELSYSLWEKRKSVARSRGEEASSKLVFPLVGIFLILMAIVASPAILLMGG